MGGPVRRQALSDETITYRIEDEGGQDTRVGEADERGGTESRGK